MSKQSYSEEGFWDKVETSAKTAGREVLRPALQLYYVQTREETPTWAKALIYSALGYFIIPIDAIPDPLGPQGYADDLAILLAAVKILVDYITAWIKGRATRKLNEWLPLT